MAARLCSDELRCIPCVLAWVNIRWTCLEGKQLYQQFEYGPDLMLYAYFWIKPERNWK